MIREKFEEISRRVWTDIDFANRYRTIYGEETITDTILLELAKQNFRNIRILQTPKLAESVQGTDWEWFVGSRTHGWIRYAIQAKKLNPKTNKYDSLNHKVGAPPNDNYQIDILQKFADFYKAIPLYNFYNFFPRAIQANHWHCNQDFDRELLGWSFTLLRNVEIAIGNRGFRTFDRIHNFHETLPIRCLFSCPLFKMLYQNESTSESTGNLFGVPFKKVTNLPKQFLDILESDYNTREIGSLTEFPEGLYSSELNIYPKRIAIIDLSNEELY
ncbi:DUF6615 family protein [Larkinella sp. C7]|uniref:DUF6615 family protein n=1 Tax=Larkinella sp. C7 TaxID=2576607 RepID=UPI001111301A|nr:DUF6615 family protein [Larkinella sp. C7]